VQIATELKGLYPDVATALSSVEAQGIRVNNAFKGMSGSIESTLTNDLTDIATGSKTAGDAFTDMANQMVRAIEQMIIKIMIVEPLMRSLQSMFSGGINRSGLGFNPIAGATGSAHGNVFAGGRIIPFARGGVVDSPSIAPMALFGEAGPEAIVPLKRGADGNLGIASSGGGRGVNVTVNVHNAPAGVQSQTSRVDSNGNIAVDVILKR
jgi:lambda family phage tail tape measure protein